MTLENRVAHQIFVSYPNVAKTNIYDTEFLIDRDFVYRQVLKRSHTQILIAPVEP